MRVVLETWETSSTESSSVDSDTVILLEHVRDLIGQISRLQRFLEDVEAINKKL